MRKDDSGKSILYLSIQDNLNRYLYAVSVYEKEMKRTDCTEAERLIYQERVQRYTIEIQEMRDVLAYMDQRYETTSNSSLLESPVL